MITAMFLEQLKHSLGTKFLHPIMKNIISTSLTPSIFERDQLENHLQPFQNRDHRVYRSPTFLNSFVKIDKPY